LVSKRLEDEQWLRQEQVCVNLFRLNPTSLIIPSQGMKYG
jgi:hypothetical protein